MTVTIDIPWMVVKVAITAGSVIGPLLVWFGFFLAMQRHDVRKFGKADDTMENAIISLVLAATTCFVLVLAAFGVIGLWNAL